MTLELNYTYQDIDPAPANLTNRDRSIYGATLSYLLLRPPFGGSGKSGVKGSDPALLSRRGIKLFGGFARDFETFGTVGVDKSDYFIGATAMAVPLFDRLFDFTLQ